MSNEIKVIFIDFDWTLFDHKTRSYNLNGVEALKKVHDKNIKLILNSARSYYSLKMLDVFKLIPFDGMITSNGGECLYKDKTLYYKSIEKETVNNFISFLNNHNFSFILITKFNNFISIKNDDKEKIINDFYKVYYEPFPLDISFYKDEDVLAFQVFSYQKDDELLKKESDKYDLFFDRFTDNNVEITKYQFLKSEGIDEIFSYLNLKKEEAMAFGDDLNDIAMFKRVKYGICMGNGKDEAKKEAYYVSENIEDDGMAKALKKFNLID